MTRTRAADDSRAIRARMEELRQEHERVPSPETDDRISLADTPRQ
jgi:hypothetical protein